MIAFVGGKPGKGWGIYVVGWDGLNLRRLTAAPAKNRAIYIDLTWSPNGRQLAFTYKADILQPNTQICSLNINQPELNPLTPVDSFCLIQSWQPDGTIAYVESVIRPGEEDRYLCLMDSDGRQARRWLPFSRYRGVNFETGSFTEAKVSPLGESVALVDAKTARLFLVQGVEESVRIENLELKIHQLAWAPDGRRLAVTGVKSQALRQRELYTLDVETREVRRLGQVAAESTLCWSPTSRWLAGVGYQRGKFDYRLFESHSGASRKLLPFDGPSPGDDLLQAPEWAPDGKRLVMIRQSEESAGLQLFDLESGSQETLVGLKAGFCQMMYLTASRN
jgi:Tol biopolymer transport system component